MNATQALSRKLRAEQITSSVRVQNSTFRTFIVPSQSNPNQSYTVNLAHETCTCPDNQYRGVACKHILAAQRAERKAANAPAVTVTIQFRTYADFFAASKI
jgi:uncharacterized Zn finger protein